MRGVFSHSVFTTGVWVAASSACTTSGAPAAAAAAAAVAGTAPLPPDSGPVVRTLRTAADWIARLRAHYGDDFPEKVTAFRPDMAVHGRYRQPCPVCGTAVQRIRYADNETYYCPRCQTGGQLLADRAISRLLRKDWPKTIDALERLGAP